MGYYVMTNSGKKLEEKNLADARVIAFHALHLIDYKKTKWPVFNDKGEEVGKVYKERYDAPIWYQKGKPAMFLDATTGKSTSRKYVAYYGARNNHSFAYYSADDLNSLRKKLIFEMPSQGQRYVEFLGDTKPKAIGRLYQSGRYYYWETPKGNTSRVDSRTGALRRD